MLDSALLVVLGVLLGHEARISKTEVYTRLLCEKYLTDVPPDTPESS